MIINMEHINDYIVIIPEYNLDFINTTNLISHYIGHHKISELILSNLDNIQSLIFKDIMLNNVKLKLIKLIPLNTFTCFNLVGCVITSMEFTTDNQINLTIKFDYVNQMEEQLYIRSLKIKKIRSKCQ